MQGRSYLPHKSIFICQTYVHEKSSISREMCTALCYPYFTKVLTLRVTAFYTNCIHVFRVILRKSRQDMYVYRSIEACSCNHCCSGKTLGIRYIFRVCVCVVLVIQHAKRMRRHMWPAWLYHTFSHYLVNGAIFRYGKVIEQIVFSDSLYILCLQHFSF